MNDKSIRTRGNERNYNFKNFPPLKGNQKWFPVSPKGLWKATARAQMDAWGPLVVMLVVWWETCDFLHQDIMQVCLNLFSVDIQFLAN